MRLRKTMATKQEKARKSFNYQCNKASKCRHDKYMISCNSCPQHDNCDIQKNIDKHFNNMK